MTLTSNRTRSSSGVISCLSGDRVFGEAQKAEHEPTIDVKTLHAKIGQLTMENDFLSVALGEADLLPNLHGTPEELAKAERGDLSFGDCRSANN